MLNKPMNNLLCLIAAVLITSLTCRAGSAEQEKAFIDKYKTAFEAKDNETLWSFYYTEGADPTILDWFKRLAIAGEADGKISKIELVAITPEDAAKATEPGEGLPGGGKVCLPLKPIKKLVVISEVKSAYGSGKSTSECFVAEKDGKLVIPVPVPCEK
jgi:hypothetical protein